MQETSKILRTDTVALFERLREGNILLQEVLTGAHDNLNSLERALVTRVADFVSAMNDVTSRNGVATQTLEDQLTVFNSKTSKALEDLGSLSSQFETHGQRAGRGRRRRRAEQPQHHRFASPSARRRWNRWSPPSICAPPISISGCRASPACSMNRWPPPKNAPATSRAWWRKPPAPALPRSAASSRRCARRPRRSAHQTLDAMNELYQQSTPERTRCSSSRPKSSSTMVQAMKQMASEMHNELEATRNELRRGVLEMPQEAAESTAQMRKVIVDQIEALAELNRIVAHHGRGLDVVTQGRASVAARGRADDGRSAARRPRRRARAAAPPPCRRRTSACPPARRTEAPPVSPAGSDGGRDGWLSDLLSRTDAGGNQAAARPRAAAGRTRDNPLESLSLDIGRLMDRNLAAEMWDRYQRGESKAFTKRLYTPAGQKAFDEVARKYRADRGFKQTVDRYITEFERLLDEVAREERGPQALRGHLTSETGLVYTLLAHAAGRLG